MQMLMPEPQIFVEKTLALIKPDVVAKEEEIEDLILRTGFMIVQEDQIWESQIRMGSYSVSLQPALENVTAPEKRVLLEKRKLQLSPEQCSIFYADQYGKMFFPNLAAYMSSGPSVAMVLARHRAVSFWKELLGPSNSIKARMTHPHSLRAVYGTDDLRNGLHGSVSISSAEREIRFMFPEVISEPIPAGQRARDYLNLHVNPTLLAGLTALCKEKPADPMLLQMSGKANGCHHMMPKESFCFTISETWLADWLIEHNPNKPRLQHHVTEEEHQE
ncbi:nucleoside diphosphate kinase homolog 5 isoform X1 [Numida meleagris]|uniref:nucleoside diphosphate kinase homolog 5 isoform X1 n=1 Tax=Numida meleagris TaxID=8996 RepID=UPI000B3DD5BA|nr:nucleoside diphosphate kinase homolog 5 isoform X1 [Numida meleagris]